MILIDKKHHKWQEIDFSIPYDTRVDEKESENKKSVEHESDSGSVSS